MTIEQEPSVEERAAEVDSKEQRIRPIPLSSVCFDGIVQVGWVKTGVRASDKVRYYYVDVKGCQEEAVNNFLVALSKTLLPLKLYCL